MRKVSGMSWSTVMTIINPRDDLSRHQPTDLQRPPRNLLRPSIAQQVLRFHRMQQASSPTAPAA